jgi:hypothetical protein
MIVDGIAPDPLGTNDVYAYHALDNGAVISRRWYRLWTSRCLQCENYVISAYSNSVIM